MSFKFINNFEVFLLGAVANTDTTVALSEGVENFNDATLELKYPLTLVEVDSVTKQESSHEVVYVVGNDTVAGTVTVERGQEGTTAKGWVAETPVSSRFTAQTMNDLWVAAVEAASSGGGGGVADVIYTVNTELTGTATSITLEDATLFGGATTQNPIRAEISNEVEENPEIVNVTGVDGNVVTITRGEEGSQVRTWPAGFSFAHKLDSSLLIKLKEVSIGPAGDSLVVGVNDSGLDQAQTWQENTLFGPSTSTVIEATAGDAKGVVLFGAGNSVDSEEGMVVGYYAKVQNQSYAGMAIGQYAEVLGRLDQGHTQGMAIGPYAKATCNEAGSFGFGLAVGSGTQAHNSYSLAIGAYCETTGAYAVAIGASTNANGEQSIALGSSVQATGADAIAVGREASATGKAAVSMGSGASNAAESALVITPMAWNALDEEQPGGIPTFGGSSGAVVLGAAAKINKAAPQWGYGEVVIGNYAACESDGEAVVIGADAYSTGSGAGGHVVIGPYATVESGDYSLAVGYSAKTATTKLGVALGMLAQVNVPGGFRVMGLSYLPADPAFSPAMEAAGTAVPRSSQQVFIATDALDLTSGTAAVTLDLPAGTMLFIDSIDVVVVESDTPGGTPQITVGPDDVTPATYLAATAVGKTAVGGRESHDPLVLDGVTSLRVATSTAGTGVAYKAKVVFRGYVMEL